MRISRDIAKSKIIVLTGARRRVKVGDPVTTVRFAKDNHQFASTQLLNVWHPRIAVLVSIDGYVLNHARPPCETREGGIPSSRGIVR